MPAYDVWRFPGVRLRWSDKSINVRHSKCKESILRRRWKCTHAWGQIHTNANEWEEEYGHSRFPSITNHDYFFFLHGAVMCLVCINIDQNDTTFGINQMFVKLTRTSITRLQSSYTFVTLLRTFFERLQSRNNLKLQVILVIRIRKLRDWSFLKSSHNFLSTITALTIFLFMLNRGNANNISS